LAFAVDFFRARNVRARCWAGPIGSPLRGGWSMIPKSGNRFSDKIMLTKAAEHAGRNVRPR
jgi:hypothetical protein